MRHIFNWRIMGKYRNITVSGKVATGTSTLARLLEEKLGWKYWSGGEFFRSYCKEHNIPLEEKSLTEDAVERQVDFGMREKLLKGDKNLFEAWLAGFVAQQIPGVLKVLLVCDDNLRVDRFVNREASSIEEAIAHIKRREQENLKKWSRLYAGEWKEWVVKPGTLPADAEIDFWHPKLYDVVIDTFSSSKEETLQKVLDALGHTD